VDYLADTNVLIRTIDRCHAAHPDAVGALRVLLSSGDRVCLSSQNVIEFWNVCTRPIERNGLGLSPAEVDREVSRLEGVLAHIPDVPAIYGEWRRLVVAYSVSGVKVHDARLVAAMNVYGISHLLTFNRPDFARYAGIHVVHPSDVSRSVNP
jgi:predicted nucleic acid-binding protein